MHVLMRACFFDKEKVMKMILAAIFALAGVAASAATINVADAGVVCEFGGNSAPAGVAACDHTIGDLGQSANDTLNFAGSGTIAGFVRDKNLSLFADVATLVFTVDSTLTLALSNWSAYFDASILVKDAGNNTVFNAVVDSVNPMLNIGVLAAGTYTFVLDASGGQDGNDVTSNYALTIAPVPLPEIGRAHV